MKTYRVVLTSLAIVEQVQLVAAETADAAVKKAKAQVNDNVWVYQGLHDDSDIETLDVFPPV